MFFTNYLLIFLAVLLVCIIGFKKYIWFISIGYGFGIIAVGICLLIMYPSADILSKISAIIFILYGIRLSGYLAYREFKNTSYNKNMKNEISDGSNMSLLLKILLWLSCGLLYVMMTSPIIYRLNNNAPSDKTLLISIIIMLFGILFEGIADLQKNKAKKKNPNRFVDTGLYKIVRCPNYLGEIIMWTGVFISGFGALNSVGEWIVSTIGYLGIVYIMFSGARRLEIRQDKNYGEIKEYQQYKKKVPIIIPIIPLYSVKKHKWLVG